MSHRLSDEEIIERAFLSALRKHFPKPGPWQETTMKPGEHFICPKDQRIEVYIYCDAAEGIYYIYSKEDRIVASAVASLVVSSWYPCEWTIQAYWQFDNIDPVTGNVTYAGGQPPSEGVDYHLQKAREGWILSDYQELYVDNAAAKFVVQWRRRFDLEV